MADAERFTIKHYDEFERTGGWALARRSLGLMSFGTNVVSAPRTSGYEPMGWA